jgi:alkanesulfonate monooxygenase SsuD/methylene tetrahydromethanopterin reductase-like flavin-dependent oxidoreductase (luciferase family)
MFERKSGVWCDFNVNEQEQFAKILEIAEANATQAGGTRDQEFLLMMTGELRRVFCIGRDDWLAEEIRAQYADRRRDFHVSSKIVRCAHDDCGEVQEATAVRSAWRMARAQGWKLVSLANETSVDLVCPEHATELGKTQ